ncbi:MAG: polysaccharide deacetylase family protein [Ignavibacteriaceae bacterium]|nr:polysaccharide deacetylase family protein [Ignavibacteriaceae bacterium]
MKIHFVILLLFFFIQIISAQNKNICFTIDDLPVVSYGMNDTAFQRKLMDGIINSLKKHNIPAIGFVNERKLYSNDSVNKFQVSLLEKWLDNNLELGNHTFSHPDYNKVSFADFAQDVLKGELISKQILAERYKSLKYFRHPFLHIGNTKEKYDSLTNFLKSINYKIAPVTIDNEDYVFAVAYKRAKEKNDFTLAAKIGGDYITYMEKKLHFFENQSQKLFGKNINQILLMHASWLNSNYIDSLAIMLKKNGYNFISMDETLKDELYQTEITKFGNWGISWLDIWALSQGKKGDFFKDDPPTPDYIKKLAQ